MIRLPHRVEVSEPVKAARRVRMQELAMQIMQDAAELRLADVLSRTGPVEVLTQEEFAARI